MSLRHLKLIFAISFNLLLLVFINNPLGALHFVRYTSETGWEWIPILTAESVARYQLIFSSLVGLHIVLAVQEFLHTSKKQIWDIVSDIVSVIFLVIIREIPGEAVALSTKITERFSTIFSLFINLLIMLIVVGAVLKSFKFVADQRQSGGDSL